MRLLIVTIALTMALGCANSNLKRCWDESGSIGKVMCGGILIPVLKEALPSQPQPEED